MRLAWPQTVRRGFYAALLLVCVALVVTMLLRAVSWTPSDGRVTRARITAEVHQNGRVDVREAVSLRFDRPVERPRVERFLPLGEGVRQDDRYVPHRITNLTLTDGAGRRLAVVSDDLRRERRLRFELPGGEQDPDRRYVLTYTVTGAVASLNGQTVLRRDLLGGGFGRPVDELTVRVHGGVAWAASCLTGPADARRFCRTTQVTGATTTFGERQLGPDAGMAVEVRYETPTELSTPTPVPVPQAYGSTVVRVAALVLAALVLIGAFAMFRQRRLPRAWRRGSTMPVGVRPAEAGILLAGEGRPWHLSAALLDLARRGFVEFSGALDGDDSVVRQNPSAGMRDELGQFEWSLLLKIFRRSEEVRLGDLRESARSWSWELLREGDRLMLENGWRHPPSTARLQRAGAFVAMLLGVLAYAALGAAAVVRWPDLPTFDLWWAAGVAVAWSAACAHLMARIPDDALTARGRWQYAEIAAYARHVDRHGVDADDPATAIWAIALGVRPDVLELPVVAPGDRDDLPSEDLDEDLHEEDPHQEDPHEEDLPGEYAAGDPGRSVEPRGAAGDEGSLSSRGPGASADPAVLEPDAVIDPDDPEASATGYTGRLFDDDDLDLLAEDDDERDRPEHRTPSR